MKNDIEVYIADLLSVYVGGNGLPVKVAAKALGITESAVYQHRSREGACPTSAQLLRYMRILPETFGNAVNHAADLTGAYRPKAIEGCVFQTTLHAVTHTSGLLKCLADAVDDGRIDHRERASVPTHILTATTFLNAVAASYEGLSA